MKKIIIITAIVFISALVVNAQEAPKTQPAADNAEKTEEVKKEAPAPTTEEKAKEAVKETAKEIEKKADKQVQPKLGKAEYMADLSGNDENKIVAAAEWLGEKEEKAAVPQLVNLLKNDKRVKVRLHASIALGLIADESSIPALNEALTGDGNADVRYSVLLAIHRINPAKSLDALKKAKETESDPYIRDYIEKMEAKWREKK